MQILGVLAFVVALLLSVMIHEFGHYLTAKRYGMKVSEFFLGFGTRLFSRQIGETEFGIKAIPAGGYCRIEGMTPTDQIPALCHWLCASLHTLCWNWYYAGFTDHR